jgi:hypothetical protein
MHLHSIAEALQKECHGHIEWSGVLHLGGVLLAVASVVLLGAHLVSHEVSAWLAIAGSTAVGFGLWSGRRAQMSNWRSRFVRRRALLADSVGYSQAPFEVFDILANALEEADRWKGVPPRPDPYYTSTEPAGNERLRQNLVESAFWTEKLFRAGRREFLVRTAFALSSAIALGVALIFFTAGALDSTSTIHLFSVAIVFIVSADQFDAAAKWGWAADDIMRLRNIAQTIDVGSDDDVKRLWTAVTDYFVVTTVAPPVPKSLFKRHSGVLKTDPMALARRGPVGAK